MAESPVDTALDVTRESRALAWATKRVAEGHHHRCSTKTNEGCDCYFRSGEYAAAELLLASVPARSPDALTEAVRDVIEQDLFPDPDCPEGPACEGCLADAMEGKRRLVAALARSTGDGGEQG